MDDVGASRPKEKGLTRLNVTLRHLRDAHATDVRPVATDSNDSSLSPQVDLEGAKYGAISALRTGDPTKDMLTAMLVPLMFKAVFDGAGYIPKLVEKISDYFTAPPPMSYERSLKVLQMRNQWGYSIQDESSRNTVLLRAITLFIAEKDLKHKQADIDLIPLKENQYYYCSDSDDSADEDEDSRTEAGQLKKNYRLTRSAPEEQWVQVEPGVMYMKTVQNENDDGDEKSSKTSKKTITISLSANSEEKVDDFIDRAYEFYLDELRKMQDNSRYMYELIQGKSSEEDGGKESRAYRRYKLSDEKTFDSLFFPQKEALLKLLDDFQTRSGKYAIPGYPHKLGLLLHGPPGTGKTSMIKALAHHTQRNIVNVPLARIQTNAELMEVMFDNKYQVVGQEMSKKLRFKDVIFVMEDVDAISKIVHRRDGKSGKPEDGIDTQSGLVLAKESNKETPAGTSSESKLDTVKEEPSKAGDAKVEKKEEAEEKKEDSPSGVADDEDGKTNSAAELLGNLLGTAGKDKDKDASKKTSSLSDSSSSDKLNLSGILNALDGVVDSPNRILIMTTNHPEKLDSALIRPGRIDKKFLLGYMAGRQCVMMVQHYFQRQLPDEEQMRICHIIDGDANQKALEITPARLEQLCAEHDVVDSLCTALEELRDAFTPKIIQEEKKRIVLKRANSVNVEKAIDRAHTYPGDTNAPVGGEVASKRW